MSGQEHAQVNKVKWHRLRSLSLGGGGCLNLNAFYGASVQFVSLWLEHLDQTSSEKNVPYSDKGSILSNVTESYKRMELWK